MRIPKDSMKKPLALLLGIAIMSILFFSSAKAYTQTRYYYGWDTSATFDTIGKTSIVPANGTCNSTLRIYADIVATSAYTYTFQMIENGTVLFSSPINGSANVTCQSFGEWTVPKGVINATVRTTSIGTTQNVTTYLEIETVCNANNGILHINGTANGSGDGYNLYSSQFQSDAYGLGFPNTIPQSYSDYAPTHCSRINQQVQILDYTSMFSDQHIIWKVDQMNYAKNDCLPYLSNQPTECGASCSTLVCNYNVRCTCNYLTSRRGITPNYHDNTPIYYLPFNSKLGTVDIQIFMPDMDASLQADIGIFDAGSGTTVYNLSTSQKNASINTTLDPLEDYVLFVRPFLLIGGGYWKMRPPEINITLTDITPTFNCTVFSPCVNGTRILLCNDTTGFLPPQFISQSCLQANQTIYLGFEQYAPKTTTECIVGGWCFYEVADISYRNPENPHWEIIPNNVKDFAPNQTKGIAYGGTMTGSESFIVNGTTITISPISQPWNRGTNFLKLWYNPPFYTHPNFTLPSTYTCTNSSFGQQAFSTFEYVNATFLASLNFTFPSQTMSLFVDVRKCPKAPIQYTPALYCVLSGGQKCYGDCSAEPFGNYQIIIYDATTATIVRTYNDISIKENWTTIRMDVSNIINQDHNYQLVLGVSPPNDWNYDASAYCSYFDNVRLFNQATSTLDDIAIELFGKPYNELTPTEQEQVNDLYCIPPSECIGNDLYQKNLDSGVCVEKIITNYPTCVTQQQQQSGITGNQSIFTPINTIGNIIINPVTNQTLAQSAQASGFGFLLLFFTPIFWIMVIVIAFMILSSYATKHMEIGMAVGVLMMIGMASIFPELIWITISVIVIAGFIVGRQVIRAVNG